MTFDHAKPTLATMTAPGVKPRSLHMQVTQEIHRLNDRIEDLTLIGRQSDKYLVRDLARDHAERLVQRRLKLLGGRMGPWK